MIPMNEELAKEFMATENEKLNAAMPTRFKKWNNTPLAKCGQWHEMQAQMLRSFKRCGVSLQASLDVIDRDIAMHEEFAKACQEAQ